MNDTWENTEKPTFGLEFDPNLTPQIFCVTFTSTRC